MALSRRQFLAASAASWAAGGVPGGAAPWLDPYREHAARLIGASLAGPSAWARLAELTDTFGHRLSGSRALEDAIAWAERTMRADSLEHVRTEPVKVPKWVRGHER